MEINVHKQIILLTMPEQPVVESRHMYNIPNPAGLEARELQNEAHYFFLSVYELLPFNETCYIRPLVMESTSCQFQGKSFRIQKYFCRLKKKQRLFPSVPNLT